MLKVPENIWRFARKILKFVMPRRRFLRVEWSRESGTAWCYKAVRANPKRDLDRPEYQKFIHHIGEILEKSASVCIDLGCGDFRVINYLIKHYPNAIYYGIDFSDYSEEAYKTSKLKSNVFFCKEDITRFEKWKSVLLNRFLAKEKNIQNLNLVVITYGTLMYLSGKELKALYRNLHSLCPKKVCSIEPAWKLDLDEITSLKTGESFRHNYAYYLSKTGYEILDLDYLFDKEYVYYAAVPGE